MVNQLIEEALDQGKVQAAVPGPRPDGSAGESEAPGYRPVAGEGRGVTTRRPRATGPSAGRLRIAVCIAVVMLGSLVALLVAAPGDGVADGPGETSPRASATP